MGTQEVMHTPGPWYVADINLDPDEGVLGEVAIMAKTDSGITGVFCPAIALPFGSAKGPAIAMANARLIAAAPEMLKELKAIGHQVQVDTGHFNRLQRLIESIEQEA